MSSVQKNNQKPANLRTSQNEPVKYPTTNHRKFVYAVGNKSTGLILGSVLITLTNLGLMATILYFMLTFYNCQSETNLNCPYPTCGMKDEKCGHMSYFFNNGEKTCIDGAKTYGPD